MPLILDAPVAVITTCAANAATETSIDNISALKSKINKKSTGLRYKPLIAPDLLKFEVSQTKSSQHTVERARKESADVVHRRDDRLLVVIEPCSLREPESVLKYAHLIHDAATRFQNDLVLVMRYDFEEPSSSDIFEINKHLRLSRKLFIELTDMGVPLSFELHGALALLYLGDLMSVGTIDASTASSRLHRELASSVPFPVGFKIADEEVDVAVDAMTAASTEHNFLTVTPEGRAAIAWTHGNENCFAVVSGESSLAEIPSVTKELERGKQNAVLMINCSGGGSKNSDSGNQWEFLHKASERVSVGDRAIVGFELKSSSAKDCTAWEDTLQALEGLAAAVRDRRSVTRV